MAKLNEITINLHADVNGGETYGIGSIDVPVTAGRIVHTVDGVEFPVRIDRHELRSRLLAAFEDAAGQIADLMADPGPDEAPEQDPTND